MPFTFSHPAIVLPLGKIFKKYVSLTGLIIGSLTPDFEYFLRMRIKSEYGHSLIGCLWFDLPLGLILCFAFHQIIKKPLIDNLPKFIQKRLQEIRNFNWLKYFKNNWLIVYLSIIIGAYSHIFWDSFTHPNKFFVNYFGLEKELFLGLPIYKILQHFSTILGALIIVMYFLKLKINDTSVQPKLNYWIKTGILSFLILIIRIILGLKWTDYGNVIVSMVSAFLLSLLVISAFENKNIE